MSSTMVIVRRRRAVTLGASPHHHAVITGEHRGVRHLGHNVAGGVQAFHGGINDLEDGYNPGGVHVLPLADWPGNLSE